jgi:parallel beta-helix repeat protein
VIGRRKGGVTVLKSAQGAKFVAKPLYTVLLVMLLNNGGEPVAAQAAPAAHAPGAVPCSPTLYDTLRSVPDDVSLVQPVACKIELKHDDLVMTDLAFLGEEASGASLDCHGGIIGISGRPPKGAPPTIQISSVRGEDGKWSVPHDITIRNCKIYGSIRIMGLGPNGEAENVRQSSLNRNHTEFAQSAAPSDILLDNITIVADGPVPVYLSPGVTKVTLSHSVISGTTKGSGVYLDAESAHNVIADNRFDIHTRNREVLAVDGSAHNVIENNSFTDAEFGGIYLYRNCGEGGTIRHQTPQHNRISDNKFIYQGVVHPRPAIWMNATQPWQSFYCDEDPPAPFGSGADNRSFADYNTITNNVIVGGELRLIRDMGQHNTLTGNTAKPNPSQ